MHELIRQNEAKGAQRDDALTFANAVECLIQANTHHGRVDKMQLIDDLKFFFVDQASTTPFGLAAKIVGNFQPSTAAYNLGLFCQKIFNTRETQHNDYLGQIENA